MRKIEKEVRNLGSIHLKKDGKVFEVDDQISGRELKQYLNLPPDSILVNARNETILDDERIGNKLSEGEPVGHIPNWKYW
jgi:hypothetical protein